MERLSLQSCPSRTRLFQREGVYDTALSRQREQDRPSSGALSLYISHLEIGPGGRVTTHIHPDSEEAMVIVEGSLEAILGDQVVTLGEGDTVLAPAGVKHGFENRSGATARLLAIFPKTQFERVPME